MLTRAETQLLSVYRFRTDGKLYRQRFQPGSFVMSSTAHCVLEARFELLITRKTDASFPIADSSLIQTEVVIIIIYVGTYRGKRETAQDQNFSREMSSSP